METPIPAETATLDMIKAMEQLVFDAPTAVLRCFAGAMCAMGHGCLPASDLVHSHDVQLSADAIVAICWKMKGKRSNVPWAALRVGFSGRDWGAHWMGELAQQGLPGEDYILLAADFKGMAWLPRIANYYDMANAMRMLLLIPPLAFSGEQALSFTPHSWRHLYPTAAAQLDIGEAQREEI